MKICKKVAGVLVIIGALNWGLVGLNEGWNVVQLILGGVTWLEKIVYILVGLSGLVLIFGQKQLAKKVEETQEPVVETESGPEVSAQV